MKRRQISGIIAIICVLVLLMSACGGGSRQSVPMRASSGTQAQGQRIYTLPASGRYDPPIEMYTVGQQSSSMTFRDRETVEDNIHTTWAMDRFGIDLKYLWSSSTANNVFVTRMRLALSSNERMPDVVAIDNISLATDLIDSGKFMVVGDIWEQLASPNYRLAVSQDPSMWYPFTRPDGIYGFPVPEIAFNDDTILYVRTDWLEKFNLEPPKTLEEMERIMDIFVNQDPDGNGIDDTVGLAINLVHSMRVSQATPSFIFGAFGDIPGQWNLLPDGTLGYGSIQPSAKQGLATLAEWRRRGYIHQEAAIHDQNKANELFVSGKAGFIASPAWADRAPLNNLLRTVPGADFRGYRIPTGPDGKAARISNQNFRGAVLVNREYQYPEAFMLYYNYLWENFAELKAGTEFAYGWQEGYDYVMVDGFPSSNGADFPPDKPRVIAQKFTITWEGARIPGAGLDGAREALESLEYTWAGGTPRNGNELKASGFYDLRRYEGQKANLQSVDLSRRDMFTGAPTSTMRSRMEYLNTDEQQVYLKIINGDLPLDEFDDFVARWRSNGGDQITREVNEWYRIATGGR